MDKPIVLCGMGRMGWRVLEYLRAAGIPAVAIDVAAEPGDPRLGDTRLIVGDFRRREVLEAAGVGDAAGVLVLTSDDLVNLKAALMVRAISPDVRVVLRMFNQNLLGRLGKAVKNVFALSTSLLTAPILAMTAVTGQGLGGFQIEGQGPRQVAEVVVEEGSALAGRRLLDVTAPHDLQPVAHLPKGGPPRYLLDVDPDARLAAGDSLILCGRPSGLEKVLAGGESEGSTRWAGKVRRLLRVARRTLAEMDRAVFICTLVLVGVIALSTVILSLGVTKYSVPHAMMRTVSIMATGAPLGEDDFQPGWLKVFVGTLRLLGAALTAAFTAIVTNYLLRARLGGALEVRRIPEGGHVIVCGLTPVGFRTIEELIGLGQRVVAIELSADNRFVATARRLGVPVVIGDATVSEVLRQAHASDARAVVVTTNNDVVNLEVALLVREMNADQRVALLQSDPQLAQMLREAADVRLAVSAPALAAPAFVAALFGDRVRNVLLVRDRLLAMLDLMVQPDDALLAGASVRAVAVDYRLLPVGLVPAQGPTPPAPLGARLAAGDRLIGLIALTDLERLLRRQPAPRGWSVEVTGFPLPARAGLAGLVRSRRGLGAAEADKALNALPLLLDADLTRGQAEELLALLARERVGARLRAPAEGVG
jgi:Trk K+ transport system NAD-binding subunit